MSNAINLTRNDYFARDPFRLAQRVCSVAPF